MKSEKLKKPDFGLIYLTPDGTTIRVGWAQYLGLSKLPIINSVPTVMAAGGFTPDDSELTDIKIQIADHFNRDPEKIDEQINYLVKLFDIEFNVQKRILENYPFTKIDLLSPEQLDFVNEMLGTSLEYVTYKAAMKRIFNKENMSPIFKRLGVNTAPDYHF